MIKTIQENIGKRSCQYTVYSDIDSRLYVSILMGRDYAPLKQNLAYAFFFIKSVKVYAKQLFNRIRGVYAS